MSSAEDYMPFGKHQSNIRLNTTYEQYIATNHLTAYVLNKRLHAFRRALRAPADRGHQVREDQPAEGALRQKLLYIYIYI